MDTKAVYTIRTVLICSASNKLYQLDHLHRRGREGLRTPRIHKPLLMPPAAIPLVCTHRILQVSAHETDQGRLVCMEQAEYHHHSSCSWCMVHMHRLLFHSRLVRIPPRQKLAQRSV